jgi:hypothetical protein
MVIFVVIKTDLKMKKIALLALLGIYVSACNTEVKVENSEETPATENAETTEAETVEVLNYYGAEISPDGAMASNELIAALDGKDSLNVKVEGTINACCQKKGCWMDVDLGNGESMIVKFKDYGFFVPKNASGQTAILEGVAKVETQSVEWLQHKAHDAGKTQEEIDAITEPEVSVTFMADGVIIKGEIPEEEVVEETTETVEAEATTEE